MISAKSVSKVLEGLSSRAAAIASLKVGDTVMMSRGWIKSTSAGYGIAKSQGQVVKMEPLGSRLLVSVKWDDGSTRKVIDANLAKVTKEKGVIDDY